ncbi:MAG TPA: TetR/AcrR family transcriptional regulator [Chthonomonadaceae bacterium]|nr:TetR/AcrR family transcriptional regulator [Chthonomonadaceae bacterium]
MTGRKQERYDERRRQILEGALQVFATKGFLAATNKDVAAAASIHSPGLIYHYFASKEDLLRAVVESYAPPIQLLAQAETLMALPPEQALLQIGKTYLRLFDDPKFGACQRVLMGEALRSPKFAEILGEIGPLRFLQFVKRYLQRKMDEGQLQPVNPAIAARCFIGPLITHMLTRRILHLPDEPGVDAESLVATSVHVFLKGLDVNRY